MSLPPRKNRPPTWLTKKKNKLSLILVIPTVTFSNSSHVCYYFTYKLSDGSHSDGRVSLRESSLKRKCPETVLELKLPPAWTANKVVFRFVVRNLGTGGALTLKTLHTGQTLVTNSSNDAAIKSLQQTTKSTKLRVLRSRPWQTRFIRNQFDKGKDSYVGYTYKWAHGYEGGWWHLTIR